MKTGLVRHSWHHHSNCAPEVGFISLTLQKWNWDLGDPTGFLQPHIRNGDMTFICSSLHPEEVSRPQWVYLVHGETADAGYLAWEFPRVQFRITTSVNHRDHLFLALENEWNLPCMPKHSQGVQFFFFFFCTHNHKNQLECGFFSSCFPHCQIPSSHPTGSFPFSMCWDVETGAKGRRLVARLISTALKHASPKPCFPEGGRTRPVTPLWAASQCPWGRTAGRHILQTPASFVLLDDVAGWNSKESEGR